MVEHFVHTEGVTGSNPVPPTSFYVYILWSESRQRFYIGSTHDLFKRFEEHNGGQSRSTRAGKPWSLVYQERFETRVDAVRRELEIKAWKSSKLVKALVEQGSV